MAGFAFAVQNLALIFGLSIMAPETIVERSLAEIGSFRMIRIPRPAVGRNMSSWNHDGISLDGPVVHDAGMTCGTAFPLPSGLKDFHMLPMAHDQANIFHRRRKISRSHLGDPENVPVTTQAEAGIDVRFQVMRVGRSPEQIQRRVSNTRPYLVVHPASYSRPHMAGHTRHILMRRRDPTLIRRRNGMAPGAKFRLVRHRNSSGTKRNRSDHDTHGDEDIRFPSHALIEHYGGNAS